MAHFHTLRLTGITIMPAFAFTAARRCRSFDCGISGNLAAVIRAAMAGYPGCFLYWHNHAQTGFCQGECGKSQRRLILVEQRLEIKNFMYDENRPYWNGRKRYPYADDAENLRLHA